MSVLVEDNFQSSFPLNHARILYDSFAEYVTATGELTSSPADSVLTPTTHERWMPANSGDSITLEFPGQRVVSGVGMGAVTGPFSFTLELRRQGSFVTVLEGVVLDSQPVLMLLNSAPADAARITVEYTGARPSIGTIYCGRVLEMQRPFYQGHRPASLSENNTMRPTLSESGEWIGASQIRQGRDVSLSWKNLEAEWVRRVWQPFSLDIKRRPFFVAWNPLEFKKDVVFAIGGSTPQPRNSGPRDLMSVELNGIAYSDGKDVELNPFEDEWLYFYPAATFYPTIIDMAINREWPL